MGSPLGSILSDICMVDLENTIFPIIIHDFIKDWSRFVDDIIGIVRDGSIDHIIHTLNSFHPSIQFTFETEVNNKIPFLGVMIIRNETSFTTTVYRKPTNNDIYIHWDTFASESWKRGTLKTLTRRAYSICSTEELLYSELQQIRHSFLTINGYPHNIITQIFESVKNNHKPNTTPQPSTPLITTDDQTNNYNTKHLIILPYKGKSGENIICDMRRSPKSILPSPFET